MAAGKADVTLTPLMRQQSQDKRRKWGTQYHTCQTISGIFCCQFWRHNEEECEQCWMDFDKRDMKVSQESIKETRGIFGLEEGRLRRGGTVRNKLNAFLI